MSIRASIALAAYNGEAFMQEQIDSILACMSDNDELIISCDPSTDHTIEIAKEYESSDKRIHVLANDSPGLQSNFNNAVVHCSGEYIFLSDQDDVWIKGKIDKVIQTFVSTQADMVMHDGYMVDTDLNILPKSIFERYGVNDHFIPNLIRCSYWGCCMAIRASFRNIVCPFPTTSGVNHDIWIALMATRHGTIARCEDKLVLHRLHGGNVSTPKRRPLTVIARHRLALLRTIMQKEQQYRH